MRATRMRVTYRNPEYFQKCDMYPHMGDLGLYTAVERVAISIYAPLCGDDGPVIRDTHSVPSPSRL